MLTIRRFQKHEVTLRFATSKELSDTIQFLVNNNFKVDIAGIEDYDFVKYIEEEAIPNKNDEA